MRIDQLLAVPEPSFSFEFFPPRTDDGVQGLFQTVAALRALEPAFVSITYGAGGSTRSRTLELVQRIKHELKVETCAHLTCVGATREELAEVLDQLEAGGVENVLGLRGDPPKGQDRFEATAGGFQHANELIAFAQDWGFCVGGAGYPERHPESPDRYSDLLHLKAKVDAGAKFIVTQLFFDNSQYFEFVAQARRLGVHVPIIPGIMPITNVAQVERFTSLCGASIPERLRRELATRRDDPQAALEFGVAFAALQCSDLLRRGAPGIHFYTLNKSSATRAILASLRANPPWRQRD
jgi:methylenetetrahydrofolate reductase (NADPH)